MSASYYGSRFRQYEANLKSLRNRHATAVKKVNGLQKDIARLTKQARSTKSDSLRDGYVRQVEGKHRDLGHAKDAESKLAIDISTTETKLSEARRKLADANAAAERQRQRKEDAERKRREREAAARTRREEAEQRQRERNEDRLRDEQAAREAQQERQIDALQTRTTELEAQLAAAERGAAPPEISVLFLASSPQDQTALRLDRETREIQKRVRAAEHRDSIWFEWRLARQLTDLIQDLNEVRPEIVHFSGHGDADALAFEDSDGHTVELTNEQLGRLLAAAGDQVRLAVFNSCNSTAQAALACNHVDVAIGMDASIADDIAKTFAGQFYNSLGFGKSVGEAFRQAVLQIEFEHGKGHDVPRLFAAEGIDPETVVLVNPDATWTNSLGLLNEIRDLNEDAVRWLRDRDRELQAALKQKRGEMSAAGLLYSGAYLQGQTALKRQALHVYRDEMSGSVGVTGISASASAPSSDSRRLNSTKRRVVCSPTGASQPRFRARATPRMSMIPPARRLSQISGGSRWRATDAAPRGRASSNGHHYASGAGIGGEYQFAPEAPARRALDRTFGRRPLRKRTRRGCQTSASTRNR